MNSQTPGRIVDLACTVGTALIIKHETEIWYTNQTGGTSCLQPCVEGVLIPFNNDYDIDRRFLSMETELADYFKSVWGTSGATDGISSNDAAAIEGILSSHKLLNWFAVDRNQLHKSHEAWVCVTVHGDHPFYCQGFGPYPRPGILTWANSD